MIIRNAATGLAPHPTFTTENADLRKRPIYKARACPLGYDSSYGPPGVIEATEAGQGAFQSAAAARPLGAIVSTLIANTPAPRKQTAGLEVGTQAQFISSAAV